MPEIVQTSNEADSVPVGIGYTQALFDVDSVPGSMFKAVGIEGSLKRHNKQLQNCKLHQHRLEALKSRRRQQ